MRSTFVLFVFIRIFCLVKASLFSAKVIPGRLTTNVAKIESASRAKFKRKPSQLTGSFDLLEYLKGQCFTLKEAKYKYVVCPFHSVTQSDSTDIQWNGVSTVYNLGIWEHWESTTEFLRVIGASSNTKTMFFTDGTDCQEVKGGRKTLVHFSCGYSPETRILRVTEHSICRYVVQMETPIVCSSQLLINKYKSNYENETRSCHNS